MTISLTRRSLLASSAAYASFMTLSRPTRLFAQQKPEGNITFAIWANAVEQASWDPIVARFNELVPDVEVTIQAIPAETWTGFFDAVSTKIAGGQIPDVIRVATEGQRLFASRGLVAPLDDLLSRDANELAEFFDDVHPNLVNWGTLSATDGKTYYLPHGFNTLLMWCNSEVFADAGIDLPTDDWTWDDFLTSATAITKPGERFGVHVPAEYFTAVMPWFLTNGASTLNADWTKSTCATPEAIESATFMRSLVEQQISPQPGGEFDGIAQSGNGKLGMYPGGRWPTAGVRDLEMTDVMKLYAWPQKTAKGSPVGWDAHPIMQASTNKEAAWAFVKFLASKDAQEIEVSQGGPTVPPRRSLASSDAFLKDSPEGTEKLYTALDYATPIPSPNKGNIVEKDIIDTMKQILSGAVSPEEGLTQLDEKITNSLQ